jgi:ATP-dependent Clp protease protease subunit
MTITKQVPCTELWLDKDFNAANVHALRTALVKEAQDNPGKPVVLYVNSYGGHVDALMVLVDTIQEFPNVITACMGTAMSAGAVLLSCGARRFIAPNARVMVHDVSSVAFGTVIDMTVATKEVKRLNGVLRKILAKNCKKSLAEINKFMDNNVDNFMTAKQALKFGLVDEIGIPKVMQTSGYNIVVSR